MRRPRRPGLFVLTAVCTLAFVLAVIPRTATPAKADDSQNVTIPRP